MGTDRRPPAVAAPCAETNSTQKGAVMGWKN
jgi:hypothetical protein